MPAKRSVSIRVFGQEYRIRTEADASELQRVAVLVDETMARLRERTGSADTLDLAVMAAVNIARDLIAERAMRRPDGAADRLRALTDRVEASLRETGPIPG
jgi:cell division protein ZapA (FtsZ GTPase activity inhibitor)